MRDPNKHRRHAVNKAVRRSANDNKNDMVCQTGKIRYDSRRKARKGLKVARGVGGRSNREYACPACAGWHLTSKAKH